MNTIKLTDERLSTLLMILEVARVDSASQYERSMEDYHFHHPRRILLQEHMYKDDEEIQEFIKILNGAVE